MQVDKAGIYVDATLLRKVLYQALYDMTKMDRMIYGERVMVELGEFISAFAMAYDFPEERDYYIRKMCAVFSVLLVDLRIMAELNVYKGLSANEGYRHIELLSHKYNLKFKKYGTNKRNAGEYPSGGHLAERG